MSKSDPSKTNKRSRVRAGKPRALVSISLMLSLFVTAVALANWGGSRATTQGSREKKSGEMAIESFAAGSPSRELVYAGGRLIATEDCSPSLSPAYASFPAAAQSSNTIAVNSSCAWTAVASSPNNFMTITSGSPGSGNGQITYAVAVNGGVSIRSGTITVTPTGQTIGQTFIVYQGIDFLDVPTNHQFYAFIGRLSARGVTLGCSVGNYCPDQAVTREQMAAFIIRALGVFGLR